MGLRNFILKRVIYSVILVIVIIMVNFAIFKMMPGDPTQFLMKAWSRESPEVRKQQQAMLQQLWGLQDPLYIQLVKYIRNLLMWNFGITIETKEPISTVMARKVPYTLMLLGGSTVVSIILGILLGVIAIQRRGGLFDSGAVTGSLVVGSLPTFWIGLMLILIFVVKLDMFPMTAGTPMWIDDYPVLWKYASTGSAGALNIGLSLNILDGVRLVLGYLEHLFLPMLTLVIFSVGGWLLLTRATMLETITEDYVTTARAKGLNERTVLYKRSSSHSSDRQT